MGLKDLFIVSDESSENKPVAQKNNRNGIVIDFNK
jgi:hypothetical protein